VSHTSEPVVTSARGLTDALNRLAGRLEVVKEDSEDRDQQLAKRDAQLATYGRRSRHLIWITIVSLVLDLVLTAALTVVAIQAHDTSSAVAQSDRNLCLSGNVARAQQISLWNYILSISHSPTTPAQREQVAKFQAHLDQLFAPRDCSHINPQNP
jgi:hypothetical protein